MRPWTYPNFDGLLDLAQRDGVDIRPIMLRVITDSYLLTENHSPQDQRQFTELALRLLDAVDVPARAAMAERLLTYPAAPQAIIARLARDDIEVAAPILEAASVLTAQELEEIAAECSPAHADIVTRRLGYAPQRIAPPPSESLSPPGSSERAFESAAPIAVAAAPPPPVIGAAASNLVIWERAHAAPERTQPSPSIVASATGDAVAAELCELFFAAGGPERRLILLGLDYSLAKPAAPAGILLRPDIWKLETASLRHETDAVARDLQRTLGVSAGMARRIVDDELGEPIAVAAKAMELPGDVVQRMLLFLNASVGQSVDRVYDLSALYREISTDAARRLVAIWRAADPPAPKQAPQDGPGWHHVAENARRALSEIARAPAQAPRRHRDVISTR